MGVLDFFRGGEDTHREKRKAWSADVERGRRILKGQREETLRRKAEERKQREEAKRKRLLDKLNKEAELHKAYARRSEAIARRRQAAHKASRVTSGFSGFESGARSVSKGVMKVASLPAKIHKARKRRGNKIGLI